MKGNKLQQRQYSMQHYNPKYPDHSMIDRIFLRNNRTKMTNGIL